MLSEEEIDAQIADLQALKRRVRAEKREAFCKAHPVVWMVHGEAQATDGRHINYSGDFGCWSSENEAAKHLPANHRKKHHYCYYTLQAKAAASLLWDGFLEKCDQWIDIGRL